jgi:hypothetical protein
VTWVKHGPASVDLLSNRQIAATWLSCSVKPPIYSISERSDKKASFKA